MEIAPVRDDGSAGQPITITEEIVDVAPGKLPAVNSTIPANPITLFEGKVLLHFAQSQEEVHHDFFAIHSGGAKIKLTFTFNGKPNSFSFPVLVTNCVTDKDCTPRLGKNNFDFDDLFMTFADHHGIPPQLLKAQVAQESGFKPNAYRYEPLSVDFKEIAAPLPTKEERRKKIPPVPFGRLQQKALAPWALAQSRDCATVIVPQSTSLKLDSADATARQRYNLALDSKGSPLCRVTEMTSTTPQRVINSSDRLPSMENIFFTNENRIGWLKIAIRQSSPTPARFMTYQKENPPFTAQTVINSSYGLYQVLYTTAVGRGYKDKNGIGLPPGDLSIPRVSLDLGTRYLAELFQMSRVKERLSYQNEKDFIFQFGPTLRGYNAGIDINVDDAKNNCAAIDIEPKFEYACRVLKNAINFQPLPLLNGASQ